MLCLALSILSPLRAEVLIERTFLPFDAAPSSFAIGLPGGVNFCYDPLRCAVSYAWTGNFIDIATVRPGMGKKLEPVKLLGPVVYRESGPAPLRAADPARAPAVDFKGYSLRSDAVEFRYTVDGILVREEIRAIAGGLGLMHRLRIDGDKPRTWTYVAEEKPAIPLTRESDGTFVFTTPFGKAAQ
jgi:hypothetical protein